jgi:hypothetical protein
MHIKGSFLFIKEAYLSSDTRRSTGSLLHNSCVGGVYTETSAYAFYMKPNSNFRILWTVYRDMYI